MYKTGQAWNISFDRFKQRISNIWLTYILGVFLHKCITKLRRSWTCEVPRSINDFLCKQKNKLNLQRNLHSKLDFSDFVWSIDYWCLHLLELLQLTFLVDIQTNLFVEPLNNVWEMVHSKSKCCWKIHLLNPWQISENWSICRLTSSPIRPPPTPTRPPPTPTPISITLKQRANVEIFCSFFVDFLVVLIMQRGRIMQKRKSCRTLRLLSVSLRWKIYNIHES